MTTVRTHSREISVEDWTTFCDGISRHYLGRRVRIEFAGREIGLYLLAQDVPLVGMTYEKPNNGVASIEVMAGSPEHGGITHVISSPQHVWVRQEINGCDNAILIENAAGHMVLVELEAALGSDRDAVSTRQGQGCAPEKCAAHYSK